VGTRATAIYTSASHFAHAFRLTTGIAPHRHVLERRIERAKLLLTASQLPVAEIAWRVGFSTPAHFSTAFLRVTGPTPIHFRNEGEASTRTDLPESAIAEKASRHMLRR
jgi:AraC family transcriptional regulator